MPHRPYSPRSAAGRGGRSRAAYYGVTGGFSPLSISGLVAWWDASDATTLFTDASRTTGVSADGNVVKGVTDKSGSGNHLSSTTGATYKVNIQNGKSVLRFSSSPYTVTMAATATQPVTILAAMMPRAVDSTGVWLDDDGTSLSGLYFDCETNAANDSRINAGATLAGSVSVVGTWYAELLIYNGASSKIYRNGGTANASGNAGAQSLTGITLGATSAGTVPSRGDLGEMLVIDGLPSNATLDLAGNYFAGKWATTWTAVS